MTEETQERVDADDILDSVTLKIAKLLLENPKIKYNKTTLAEKAGVSKDALYDRWDTLVKGGLIEKAEVESEVDHWQLNQDTSSPLPEALGRIMYVVGNEEDNR
ncbi:hypothetical protein [Halorarum halobium]|uniref:hypothetical protein n=1 Tax=Halorarum halobium TaxID=3075121 RepID=UPI0028AA3EEE|nr:hypothetical protein [Halobaculum sp. XH14]